MRCSICGKPFADMVAVLMHEKAKHPKKVLAKGKAPGSD
jgi:hypothetical protein